MTRKRVAVIPESKLQEHSRLFALLGELYSVQFQAWEAAAPGFWDGVIVLEAKPQEMAGAASSGLDCLVVAAPETSPVAVNQGEVRFGSAEELDPCFRGQVFVEEGIKEFAPLRPIDGDELVCSLGGAPYWLQRRAGNAHISLVALSPPEWGEKQTIYENFNRTRWLRLLPYLNFLKRMAGDEAWQPPPLRACLMFDDPNLHGHSYGFINYAELVQHARDHHYHVSFAMVPLDGWFVNRSAAEFFRANQASLSLCMHGNDHAPTELGVPREAGELALLLAQGLRRVESFEERSGVSVARVMVPPHGAFRSEAARPMRALGYEAACVSRSSFAAWNKDRTHPAVFGHPVAEIVDGLPVIPRHVMRRGHDLAYRLAAFLGQPIIPHGHHQDCATGLDLLADVAGAINSIGNVVWMDMASISRSNYLTRRSGGQLCVRMLSNRIQVKPGPDATELVVERPWVSGEELLVCQGGAGIRFSGKCGERSPAVSLGGDDVIEITSRPAETLNHQKLSAPPIKPWLVARRLVSEARDRLAPFWPQNGGH